jgi:hypothetical protein
MGKVYVFVGETIVTGEDNAAKAALRQAAGKEIAKAVEERVMAALPKATFSDKDSDKPKPDSKDFSKNAVKIAPKLTLKAEVKGSQLSVNGTLQAEFEAVKLPDVKGELVAAGSKGATVINRGTVEKDLVKFAKEVLDNVSDPLVKAALNSSKFKEFIKKRGV